MAARTWGSASGYIQGSLHEPSDLKPEWIVKRGWSAPCCTQRTKSSASGRGPAKAPTSWPHDGQPLSPSERPIGMLARSVSHPVRLSPDHVCCA